MDYSFQIMVTLFCWGTATWGIKTGELHLKGSRINRAEAPGPFYLVIGVLFFLGSLMWLLPILFKILPG